MYLYADVVHSSFRFLLHERLYGTVLTKWVEQLGVANVVHYLEYTRDVFTSSFVFPRLMKTV